MDLPLKKGIHPFSFHPSISQFWVNLHIETRIDNKRLSKPNWLQRFYNQIKRHKFGKSFLLLVEWETL